MRAVLDHIVLNVRDLDAALDFYGNVLGLPIEMLDEYRRGEQTFPCVRLNETSIIDLFPPALWHDGQTAGEGRDRRMNHFCLALEEQDWQRLLAVLRERGIAIEGDPAAVLGAAGHGPSVYIRDPDDNRIELKTYPAG